MQQLVYDIIERCIPTVPNNNNENNSVHSDMTNTPPLSTKNGSNNSCKESQKDIQVIKKKIFFIDYNNNKNKIIKNKKEKKFLAKKRKRFFLIKKIQRNKNETVSKKLPKINKIIFNNFKLEKIEQKNNLDNNTTKSTKTHKYFINVLVNKDKNIFNNNNIINNNINIKQDENLNNNIKTIKTDDIMKNSNKNIINNDKNNSNNSSQEEQKLNETEKNNKKVNEIKRKKKKSNYTTEKELQIAYEKKFLENINKNYSDKEYEEDIKQCLKDKKKKFMKDNFPIMYQKDKFYLYSILPKKRLASKEYYIKPDFFDKKKSINNFDTYLYNNEIKDVNYSNNNNNKNKNKKIFKISKTKKINKKNNLLINKEINEINDINSNDEENIFFEPKKVWSLKKEKKINVDDFLEDCTQIWPFDECCFIKEIALEFLMKKNYSIKYCLDNIKEFVFFMKKRAKELDFPIISDSVKTIKKYHLRKTNYN